MGSVCGFELECFEKTFKYSNFKRIEYMTTPRLIIFDLDGTLLDTGKGIIKCIKSTLEKMGFNIPNDEICKSFVGPPLKKRFLELYEADESTADIVMKTFREEYGKGDVFLADRYAGMSECLATLQKQHSLAVATYKREDHAIKLLEKFEMSDFFDIICGSDPAATMTKNQIIEKAIKLQGANPANCLMIGDSDNDAVSAAQLGIPFIGVTYGYGFKSKADVAQFPHIACVDNPLQLKEIIMG